MQPAPDTHSSNGSRRRAVGFLAVALLVVWAPRPASAWSDPVRRLIIEEAVRRLPDPMRGLLDGPTHLGRLQDAAAAPADDADTPGAPYQPDQDPRRVFRIDAAAGELPAFADIPRRQAEAEAALGAETVRRMGTAPWAATDALDRLAHALTDGRTDAIFASAGDLARIVADLHMPLHTTVNHDGQLTGNHGIGGVLAVGLIGRRLDACRKAVRQDRQVARYLADPADSLFNWLATAHGRTAPILEADTAARNRSTYNPAQHPEDLASPDAAKPYYEALAAELARRGAPEAAALRDAAAHLADLLYTAWVRAGKPLTLQPPDEDEDAGASPPYWLIALAAFMLFMLFWPRRQARPGDGDKGSAGSDPP